MQFNIIRIHYNTNIHTVLYKTRQDNPTTTHYNVNQYNTIAIQYNTHTKAVQHITVQNNTHTHAIQYTSIQNQDNRVQYT